MLDTPLLAGDRAAIAQCRERAIALLLRNAMPSGIAAAAPDAARNYDAIFARDAAICAFGMALSGSSALQETAIAGLKTLARHQAPNGQIPNFVRAGGKADFWYLGCLDATLWWLLAVDFLDAVLAPGLRRRLRAAVAPALAWLRSQEHQRLHLLVQAEASDWADIMPRAGFVLYGNALWYRVKQRYALPGAEATQLAFDALFDPWSAPAHGGERRAEVLREYVKSGARRSDLYLSFVGFASWGEEGDVFGNLLAVLAGLADAARAERILRALLAAQVHRPYPVRAVVTPIAREDPRWRAYMLRHRQNLPWQYHNGGIWPYIGAFWVIAVDRVLGRAAAERELAMLARANRLGGWQFNEWLHGRHGRARGMPQQSWNAAAFLLADAAVRGAAEILPF
ncbi:MAG TPA: glycoside hydrolase 100 family protein [Gammaproteobacteria bacterium]|nr:glycoside hydrolase 100 family protein [Gammaproteobacteria bacterium]